MLQHQKVLLDAVNLYIANLEECGSQAKETLEKVKETRKALLNLPIRVSTVVSGGVVQAAVSNDPTVVFEVYDLDSSDFVTVEEQEALKLREEEWEEIVKESYPIY